MLTLQANFLQPTPPLSSPPALPSWPEFEQSAIEADSRFSTNRVGASMPGQWPGGIPPAHSRVHPSAAKADEGLSAVQSSPQYAQDLGFLPEQPPPSAATRHTYVVDPHDRRVLLTAPAHPTLDSDRDSRSPSPGRKRTHAYPYISDGDAKQWQPEDSRESYSPVRTSDQQWQASSRPQGISRPSDEAHGTTLPLASVCLPSPDLVHFLGTGHLQQHLKV